MSGVRWADLTDDDPWPEPPPLPEPTQYTPPHKRRPRLAEKKVPPPKGEKEKSPK